VFVVGTGGDRRALLGQHSADRLDSPSLPVDGGAVGVLGDEHHEIRCGRSVKSAQSAVSTSGPIRFSGPLPEPGVRLAAHRALHKPRIGVVVCSFLVRRLTARVQGCSNRGRGTGSCPASPGRTVPVVGRVATIRRRSSGGGVLSNRIGGVCGGSIARPSATGSGRGRRRLPRTHRAGNGRTSPSGAIDCSPFHHQEDHPGIRASTAPRVVAQPPMATST